MEIERLYKAVASVLDIDESTITPESKFADDLGADSLDVLEIIMSIEEEFILRFQLTELKILLQSEMLLKQ